MKINCYIAAFNAYRDNKRVWMACRRSPYSKALKYTFPKLVMWIGLVLLWSSSGVWMIGHFLYFRTWPHWIWCTGIKGDCYEAVPLEPKTTRLIPPLFFTAVTKKRS